MSNLKYDKNKLVDLCHKYRIKLMVLHGSYAKGIASEKSDIDIGVMADSQKTIKREYSDILGDLISIFGDKVDPVFLNGTESMITYHVAINGIPIYEERPGIFNNFRAGAIGRYIDTKKFRMLDAQYVKKAAGL